MDQEYADRGTPLMRAAAAGNEARVAALLRSSAEDGGDAAAASERRFLGPEDGELSALDLAVAGGHEAVVRRLLDAGAEPSARQSVLWETPLMRAARHGHADVIRLLVGAGADLDEHDYAGSRPLMLAALFGHRAAVETLLDLGASLETESRDGYTALLHAIHGAHPDIVRLLAERGGRIDRHDAHGFTYLMHPLTGPHFRKLFHARRPEDARTRDGGPLPRCDVEVAGLLLALGADVHLRGTGANAGKTPLMQAALEGRTAVATMFLTAGADLRATDPQGRTALTWALIYNRKPTAAWLREHGAPLSLLDAALLGDEVEARRLLSGQQRGRPRAPASPVSALSPLAYFDPADPPLVWAVKGDRRTAVDTLLRAGAEVDVRDARGRTPLMHAARFPEAKQAERLLRAGADPNAADNAGVIVLMHAASAGVARALLAAGAGPDGRHGTSGETCLMRAAAFAKLPLMRVLLAAGADVGAADGRGWTALHHACGRGGGPAAVRELLAAGADRDVRTADGDTPADLARRADRENVLKLL